jgi:hypothetical protein
MYTLDKYDNELIAYLKQTTPLTIKGLKEIYAKRVEINVEYIHTHYIATHFLHIIQELNLTTLENFAVKASPDCSWIYNIFKDAPASGDYWTGILSVASSILMMTKVDRLPGYISITLIEPELKKPEEWCKILGHIILDPDGWRSQAGPYPAQNWDIPVSKEEFETRSQYCTKCLNRDTFFKH